MDSNCCANSKNVHFVSFKIQNYFCLTQPSIWEMNLKGIIVKN